MFKRARTTSYGDYNQVSQSENTSGMYRPYLKGSSKVPKRKPYKKITKTDINRAISRRLENKTTVDFAANQTIIPADAGFPPTTRYLLPILTQGLGQGGRIGNSVHIRSGKICMFINMAKNSTNVDISPLMVRIWVLSYKAANNNAAPSFTTFFQTGNATVGFQKTMLDMILPVNTDQFTVYFDKTYKIGFGGIPATNTNASVLLDDSSINKRIDIDWGQHFKQSLDYNDTDNVPQNRNLHIVWQAVQADGSSPTSTTVSGAEYHLTNTVKYEDG